MSMKHKVGQRLYSERGPLNFPCALLSHSAYLWSEEDKQPAIRSNQDLTLETGVGLIHRRLL